jgi:hypothetical protein
MAWRDQCFAVVFGLAFGLGGYGTHVHWSEGRRWLNLALSSTTSAPDYQVGNTLFKAGVLAWLLGDLESRRQREKL